VLDLQRVKLARFVRAPQARIKHKP